MTTTRRTRRKPRHIVIITGNRSWEDDPQGVYATCLILTGLRGWHERIHLFHGACGKGADHVAADAATNDKAFKTRKIREHPFPVDWHEARRTLGANYRAAGNKRNEVMVQAALSIYDPRRGDTIECWAFTDNIRERSGTQHCAKYAAKNDIPTFVVGRL